MAHPSPGSARSMLSAAVQQEELEAFVQQKISEKSFLLEGHAERFLHLGHDHSYATIRLGLPPRPRYQLPPRGESLQLGRVFQAQPCSE